MVDQYGGTPFSHFLGGSKKRKSRYRTGKRRPKRQITKKPSRKKIRTNKRLKGTKKINCKTCKCSCEDKFTGKEPSPKGLGFCEKCQPLNVIMRGKDGKLWKIEKKGNIKKWVKVN